ncbi:MAG: hypothetical protein L3K03_04325 [Thermoplasmata archaeon]|nr:hypothetical protein [Thermoplasmata archaeon]
MAGAPPSGMAAGPVKLKRKYKLWLLVVLIFVCWPAAIVYYFTRPKVGVQEFAAPPPPA